MVELMAPSGAVVQARDEAVKGLLDAGFVRVDARKPAPRRRRTTKRTTAKG